MKSLCVGFIILFSSLFSWAQENKLTVLVSLSPSGSFKMTSQNLKGSAQKIGGKLTADQFSVTVASLKTGINLRDEHLRKHLNPTEKTPRIILSNIKSLSDRKGTADLEVNGVKSPVQFDYVEKSGMVEAQFEVKPSIFKLAKASYLGVGVKDLVKVIAVVNIENTK